MQESQYAEPCAPQHHLIQELNIDDAKHENEFVEDVVTELVLDMLLFGNSQVAKD